MAKYKLVQSPNRYNGRNRKLTRIGIHCTQTPEDTAPGVANYFKRKSSKASAHAVVDTDEVICCVKWHHTAWAMQRVNSDGYHIELCGYAQWSKQEWLSGKGKQVMIWSACVAAEAVVLFRFLGVDFDVRMLSDKEILNGTGTGFVQHRDADRVFKDRNPHTDLGANFPVGEWLKMVKWWIPHIKEVKIH